MAKISIQGMQFNCIHGVYDWEQSVTQDFFVDLEIEFQLDDDLNDTLRKTIDYQIAFDIVKRQMEIPSKLLESVCQAILNDISSNLPLAHKALIRIYKHPQLGGPYCSLFVEESRIYSA